MYVFQPALMMVKRVSHHGKCMARWRSRVRRRKNHAITETRTQPPSTHSKANQLKRSGSMTLERPCVHQTKQGARRGLDTKCPTCSKSTPNKMLSDTPIGVAPWNPVLKQIAAQVGNTTANAWKARATNAQPPSSHGDVTS